MDLIWFSIKPKQTKFSFSLFKLNQKWPDLAFKNSNLTKNKLFYLLEI